MGTYDEVAFVTVKLSITVSNLSNNEVKKQSVTYEWGDGESGACVIRDGILCR